MDKPDIAHQRLSSQGLEPPTFKTPSEVVTSLGAVQAQDYAGAKWSLAQRLRKPLTDDALEKPFADGTILRTHVLRPTWHFVSPQDIRWLLNLTAPRVHAANAHMYRKLEQAQDIAAHADPRTTRLYDRRNVKVERSENLVCPCQAPTQLWGCFLERSSMVLKTWRAT